MAADVLDPDLEAGLRQAKKMPRNYAVIVKGAKAVKLLVDKKPIKPSDIQSAKAEAKGTGFYKGVCQGDGGAEMVFKLVGDDPGIKSLQFKEFIAEQTGLAIKPRFEVVTELADINDDADASAGDSPSTAAQDWQKAKEAWEQAANAAGQQVNELAAVLSELGPEDLPAPLVEDLKAIAKIGLPALTKNLRTPLVAAILDVERAPADKRPAPRGCRASAS